MRTSDLPFGSEFSPSQIDLADLLGLSHSCGGSVSVLQAAIKDRFFARHGGGNETNREKLAMNCRLGMKAYGLIDEAARLTDFGRTLLKLQDDPQRLYEALARHGLALEALAFKLMRLLGMDYVATRLRAQATGGAEVDLIFESARLVFSRWQVQCKNTARVALDDVAKEVGLTAFLKSNAIVIVSTGSIGTEARRYANRIMSESNLCIVMIDKGDLDAIARNPAHVVAAFQREARHAMQLKKLDI